MVPKPHSEKDKSVFRFEVRAGEGNRPTGGTPQFCFQFSHSSVGVFILKFDCGGFWGSHSTESDTKK